MVDISDYRREYMSTGVHLEELDSNPVNQFETWFKQATDAGVEDANALSLATADHSGAPSIRTVLLKLFDDKGFIFFTNYNSRKAKQIAENNQVAMLFPWLPLNRQIKIEGHCEKISSTESFKYFLSRPRGSQIGAWCSPQSDVIESRQFLEQKFAEMKAKFNQGDIPLPSFWGGYRVIPHLFEFWQGRENRLHDRFQYTPTESGSWNINRLAP